jgi:GNAT superfamily N-acetyltransferase
MIEAVGSERSLSAAKSLIRDHFEAHSEAHDPSQIAAIIDKLPSPYVPPAGGLWVAWDGDEATGCVALQSLADGVGEVKRMYVKPEHRGKGIAREMAKLVIEEARARGYSRLRLGTLASMRPAQNLYTSLGFVPIDPYRNIEFGTTLFYELKLEGKEWRKWNSTSPTALPFSSARRRR